MSKDISKALVDKVVSSVSNKINQKINSMTQPKKKKNNKKNKTTSKNSNSFGKIVSKGPTATLGFNITTNRFNTTGRPQPIADHDATKGIRVTGSSLYIPTVNGTSDSVKAFRYGGAYYGLIPLTCQFMDPRLAAFWAVYDYYSFRYVKITYIPQCATTLAMTVALGICPDYTVDLGVFPTPTQQVVLEYESSVLTTVWSPASITWTNRGTETYNTSASTQVEAGERYQIALAGAFSAVSAGTNSNYGQIVIDYVCDLYQPAPYDATTSLTTKKFVGSHFKEEPSEIMDLPDSKNEIHSIEIPPVSKSPLPERSTSSSRR